IVSSSPKHVIEESRKPIYLSPWDLALLSVNYIQKRLTDGIFIRCSFNHVVADGTSYWHFLNSWSEIFQGPIEVGKRCFGLSNSRSLSMNIWFPQGMLSLRKVFHFSNESVAKLKAKPMQKQTCPRFHPCRHYQLICNMAINNRTKVGASLPPEYFGNCLQVVRATASANELLQEHNNLAVNNHTRSKRREFVDLWFQNPFIVQMGRLFDPCSVMMGSSPRFNMYGNEFGLET
ncbi:hypothetical protein Leryth_010581, partial [Lithospermum erythrorhizon]